MVAPLAVFHLLSILAPTLFPHLLPHWQPPAPAVYRRQSRAWHRRVASIRLADTPGATDAAAEAERVAELLAGCTVERTEQYGSSRAQHFELYLPSCSSLATSEGSRPFLLLVHGGFWKSKWDAHNTQSASLMADFLARGFGVALLEYRRREMIGGLWPGPEDDVAEALTLLLSLGEVDADRVVVLGHSAGAQMAIRAVGRLAPRRVALCVAVAPPAEMLPAHEAQLSDEGDAIERYLGFPPDSAARRQKYLDASCSALLPLTTPTLLVVGSNDVDVPPPLVREFFRICTGQPGAECELLELAGAGHYDVVTAGAAAWRAIARRITALLQASGWDLPPHPPDYGVSEERGFLPPIDPLDSLLHGAEAGGSGCYADTARLCSAWEECAAQLPPFLASGSIRRRILQLPVPSVMLGESHKIGVASELMQNSWLLWLAADERRLERGYLLLSFLAHAFVWGEEPVATTLPPALSVPWCAIADALHRRPILTYASFNLYNWRRLDPAAPVTLGNTCRLCNFLGGQDEEWFSAVHVAIEGAAGRALAAAAASQREAVGFNAGGSPLPLLQELHRVGQGVEAMTSLLRRMYERCDPYIYHARVRLFMSGWTHESFGDDGLEYEGVAPLPGSTAEASASAATATSAPPAPPWRREKYFGETGAQSSAVPALDAALGIEMSQDELLPYLLAMREYMPEAHAEFIEALENGPSVRETVLRSSLPDLQDAYDHSISALLGFRKLHFELAFKYVRQWDPRADDEISGTGGTPFMPYLRKHRRTTHDMLIHSKPTGLGRERREQ